MRGGKESARVGNIFFLKAPSRTCKCVRKRRFQFRIGNEQWHCLRLSDILFKIWRDPRINANFLPTFAHNL